MRSRLRIWFGRLATRRSERILARELRRLHSGYETRAEREIRLAATTPALKEP